MNISLLIDFIKKESKDNSYKTILIMTLISGLANALLLSVINYSTSKIVHGDFKYRFIIIFILIFLIFIIAKNRALKLTAILAETIVFSIRERIVKYLMNTELQQFEELGRAEIYTRLTKDTNEISNSASSIANGFQAGVLVFFAIIYLGFINLTAFVITIVMLILAISNYFMGSNKIQSEIGEAVALETVYFEKINEVTGGFKEIKINQQKKLDLFFDRIQSIAGKLKDKKIITSSQMSFYFVFAQAFFYILLGTMVFVIPVLDQTVLTDVAKITATILFIIMPLGDAVGTFEVLNKATVAVTNLTKLEQRLKEDTFGALEDPKLEGIFSGFEKIKFNDLHFAYRDKVGRDQFGIGPINFEVNKGEIIFIIGGNGSGKSTLIKLLTGLYTPDVGEIFVDDLQVIPDNIQEYRDLFGVIFADFFLFSEMYGIQNLETAKVLKLLKQMHLSEKTGFKDGAFTNTSLSTGQRKRLAMISVILENKSVLIFDEWAADQDPEFRKYFYNELLYDFKKLGKTIIAITHDDHYFNNADRIYKMDYGTFSQYSTDHH
ncbi:cyclic peptide export ABC transporter [Mucilaginibacter aquaedulcis]|uniref:cyclic peptide export ABC transporter n=1 Tax=Mucilaginibacter aquaedulcis TaxID=1187081 RepID=UPI0025B56626|nr:cyclic peptide export ABC transporter [Mucilaginibacter aquaedulcis]MDN3546947.1 cyclic peptide export ABC transporter [Mucilaginibacter aquaedulcis]